MAASVNDYFQKLGGASSLVNTPKVTATRSSGGTTLTVDNCNWDTTTGKRFATFQVDTSGNVVDGTETIWKGIVTSTTSIGSLARVAGASDSGNAIGDYVMLLPASDWANQLVTGLLVEHNQDGTHGDVTADSIAVSGSLSAASLSVNSGAQGMLGDVVIFTSSGTWTKDANLKFIEVEVQGGGGGGGGTAATSSGQAAVAAGGGGGGYSRKRIAASALGSTETVTVGAGGSAATAGNNSGGTGGTSSFGSHFSATGGIGGNGSGATSGSTLNAYGDGGSGSGGDLNVSGGGGGNGAVYSASRGALGFGGPSFFGGTTGQNTAAGNTGKNYGGGGSGAMAAASTSAQAGGAGAPGIVIVREYY